MGRDSGRFWSQVIPFPYAHFFCSKIAFSGYARSSNLKSLGASQPLADKTRFKLALHFAIFFIGMTPVDEPGRKS